MRLPRTHTLRALAGLGAALLVAGCSRAPERPPLALADVVDPTFAGGALEAESFDQRRVLWELEPGTTRLDLREEVPATSLAELGPGLWAMRSVLDESPNSETLHSRVRIDGEGCTEIDLAIIRRPAFALDSLTDGPYFARQGSEVFLYTGAPTPPDEVLLERSVRLGAKSEAGWRSLTPDVAGAGWTLPMQLGAEGEFNGVAIAADELPEDWRSAPAARFEAFAGHLGTEGSSAQLVVELDGVEFARHDLPRASRETALALAVVLEEGWSELRCHVSGDAPGVLLAPELIPERTASVRSEAPDVLVFLADTFRADLLSFYRPDSRAQDPVVLPAVEAWAADATIFERHWSMATGTLASQASLLSGVGPAEHGAVDPRLGIGDDVLLLPEQLRAAGYRTLAVTDGAFLRPHYGFDRGFDVFDSRHYLGPISGRFEPWLEGGASRPLFAYLQTYQVHQPYTASPSARERFADRLAPGSDSPEVESRLKQAGWNPAAEAGTPLPSSDEFRAALRGMRDLYVAGAYDLDRLFTEVHWTFMEHSRDPENAVVVFTSDHGEAFGEHDLMLHGGPVYDELARVPLILRAPSFAPGRRTDAAHTLDLAPTLAELVGIGPSDAWVGSSLLAEQPAAAVWSVQVDGRPFGAVSRTQGALKLLRVGAEGPVRAFDLDADPDELRPLSPGDARVASALEAFREGVDAQVHVRPSAGRPLLVTDADRSALEALGYAVPSQGE